MKLGIILGALIIGLFLTSLFAPFTMIGTGQIGVISMFGKVQEEPIHEGFHFVSPLADVTAMSIQMQKDEGEFNAASKDMQHVGIKMIINYRLQPDVAPKLYKDVGDQYVTTIIHPAASETVKAELALHNASEILEKRSFIRSKVQEALRVWIIKYGIIVDEMSFSDISFSEEYENAIEKKQLEEQKAEQKKYELLQARSQAEIRAAQAKGEADAKIAGAVGDARARQINADAEAEYNKKVAESITTNLLKLKYYEAWDGKLPKTILGQDSAVLLNIPGEE